MKGLLIIFLLLASTFCIGQNSSSIKLFRFGNSGNEKPAVLTSDGKKLDVSAFGEDYNEKFFENNGIGRLEKWLIKNKAKCPAVPANTRIASCVARPSKIVAIGLNYAEHVRESGLPTPPEPVIFLKATSALCGPYDSVIIPLNSFKTDYEVELAIVIGKKASYIPEAEAMKYIAGYTIINDYSEREWQLERTGGQWDKGKSANSFAPLGPYLVTAEEIGDPNNLKIWLKVNGTIKQQTNTSEMIFKVARLVSEVSQFMTLLPGDVIATGTPSGVGHGSKPQQYLRPGDVVELGIEKIGAQKQVVGSAIKYFLTDAEYKDYQDWVALGVGGLPHTLEGYRTVKMLGKRMKDPLDLSLFSNSIGKPVDTKSLFDLPGREGKRPTIAPFAVPHRQTDQQNGSEARVKQKTIFDEIIADNSTLIKYKKSYFEKHNESIFLIDSAMGNPGIMPVTHAEIAHIHPSEGSMHMTLSPSDAKEVIEKGWGELHGLAGQVFRGKDELPQTYMMIYAPRNDAEMVITKRILEAAIKYASKNMM